MKFWQKAFIGILIVFIISINTCLFLTSNYSFSLNIKRDSDRALGEYHFIMNGVYGTMNSIYYREPASLTPSAIDNIMRSYADYYGSQKVFLEFKDSDKLLFSNIPLSVISNIDAESLTKDSYQTKVLSDNEINYLYIVGKLGVPYEDYTLIYVRDLSELYNNHSQLTRYLISVSALVETVLALVLLLLLKKLTFPIRIMQKATRKIAGGVFDERIIMPGKDEFHDLAENFNQMADSIQEKITELNKTARDKQRLVDNLAHELRTPLTAIYGYAEYLQNTNSSELNRIKAARYILTETDRMKNLAFKLLDLALVRNSKLDLQPIIPLELLHAVKTILEAKLKDKSIQLDIDSSLAEITGDFILLQSMLVNLVDNAMKASAYGSSIQLSSYFNTAPIIEVKDSGCGMEEDQIALVCEPFYRVDKARSRSAGGIGLGLSLCREIAHLHGAELKITSCLGKGTTVQVIFTTSLQPSENSLMHKDV